MSRANRLGRIVAVAASCGAVAVENVVGISVVRCAVTEVVSVAKVDSRKGILSQKQYLHKNILSQKQYFRRNILSQKQYFRKIYSLRNSTSAKYTLTETVLPQNILSQKQHLHKDILSQKQHLHKDILSQKQYFRKIRTPQIDRSATITTRDRPESTIRTAKTCRRTDHSTNIFDRTAFLLPTRTGRRVSRRVALSLVAVPRRP